MMGMCEHSNEPLGSIKADIFWTLIVTISFSRRSLHHEFILSNDFESCGEEIYTKQLL
jgi:hypothetical protein